MALPTMSPAPTNTYIETTAPNVREDLADIIYRIDPEETPLVSLIARSSAQQVLTEWEVQELNTAANVPQPEGFTAAMSPPVKPVRINNICQILARTVAVSNTLRAVNTIGGDEYERQLTLRGKELKRDLELTITGEVIKTTTDPRRLSGIQTYITNGSVGAGTGALPLGDGTNGHTAGTTRNLSLDLIEDAMQMAWDDGGQPSVALMSSSIKRYFSTMAQGGAGNPTVASQVMQSTTPHPITIMGAVGVFLTDFGPLELVPDRFMPAHVVELIDTGYVELAPLPGRDMIDQTYAVTGDNSQGGVVWEGSLKVLAPKSCGAVWDLIQ